MAGECGPGFIRLDHHHHHCGENTLSLFVSFSSLVSLFYSFEVFRNTLSKCFHLHSTEEFNNFWLFHFWLIRDARDPQWAENYLKLNLICKRSSKYDISLHFSRPLFSFATLECKTANWQKEDAFLCKSEASWSPIVVGLLSQTWGVLLMGDPARRDYFLSLCIQIKYK